MGDYNHNRNSYRYSGGGGSAGRNPQRPPRSQSPERQPYSPRPQTARNQNFSAPADASAPFPWQLFAAVGLAVLSIVIFSVAMAMFSRGVPARSSTQPSAPSGSSGAPSQTAAENVSSDGASSGEETVNRVDFTGSWRKTDAYESQKATLSVTDQDEAGFTFTLKVWNGKKTATVSGVALYTGNSSAAFTKGLGALTFERGSEHIAVYHSGELADLGLRNFQPDGSYITGQPRYYTKEETEAYDYNAYQSDAVKKALADRLSADDLALWQEMMSKGLQSPIDYERKLDKNGREVNVDTELNCVKYYASLSDKGMHMTFICSGSGKIYVLFYSTVEMRYYTNDKNYASKMPASFQAVAKAYKLTPVFK